MIQANRRNLRFVANGRVTMGAWFRGSRYAVAATAVAVAATSLFWPRHMSAPSFCSEEPYTLAELARRSDLIVAGLVRRRVATLRDTDGRVYTRWVVLVLEALNRRAKAYVAGEILVDHLGGRWGLIRYRVAGDPGLSLPSGRRPDWVVLFLKRVGDNIFTIVGDPCGHLILRDERVYSLSVLTGSSVPDLGLAGVAREEFFSMVRRAAGEKP